MSGPARLGRTANPARALSDLALLDRLIKGRAWIAVVAFALIGIVTMQLALLKLNAGIGRALVHEAALERENSALSVEQSEASAANTIEHRAGQLGMQLIPAGAVRFLSAQGPEADVSHAVAALNADAAGSAATTAGEGTTGSSSEVAAGTGTTGGEAAAGASSEASATTGTSGGEEAAGASGEASPGAASEGAVGGGEAATSEAGAGATGEAAAPSSSSAGAGSAAGAVEGGSAETGASASSQG